jgi:hypothetical protein
MNKGLIASFIIIAALSPSVSASSVNTKGKPFLGIDWSLDSLVNSLDFHAAGEATYMNIKGNGERLSPSMFHLTADVEFKQGMFDGLGLMAVYGIPISDAKKNALTLEITQQQAVYLTLTDPTREPGDLKFSLLLGHASTELDTKLTILNAKNSDTFTDFSYGFSLQDAIVYGKPFYWTLNCIRYFKDDNLSIDGYGFGITYDF